jgi:hypothetical protein
LSGDETHISSPDELMSMNAKTEIPKKKNVEAQRNRTMKIVDRVTENDSVQITASRAGRMRFLEETGSNRFRLEREAIYHYSRLLMFVKIRFFFRAVTCLPEFEPGHCGIII